MEYVIYRVCERFGLKFLSSDKWDDLTASEQAKLIAYEDIREQEDVHSF